MRIQRLTNRDASRRTVSVEPEVRAEAEALVRASFPDADAVAVHRYSDLLYAEVWGTDEDGLRVARIVGVRLDGDTNHRPEEVTA